MLWERSHPHQPSYIGDRITFKTVATRISDRTCQMRRSHAHQPSYMGDRFEVRLNE
ncbi:MAG: hypothetical protein V7K25_17855 [Nostoc sp.]|uniref:hypothetical protein n=1 Tax=Nostoc sp. TaxID=1180 RepID=UPI002FF7568D